MWTTRGSNTRTSGSIRWSREFNDKKSVDVANGANQQGPAAVESDNPGHPEPSYLQFAYVVKATI